MLTEVVDFLYSAWGKTIWGSQADLEVMDTEIKLLRQSFPDVPLIMGEWGISPSTTEPASRWRWIDALSRTAAKYNTTTFFWDNGDQFDRAARKWQDPTALAILLSAQKGNKNSLPVTVEEIISPSLGRQNTSAYIFSQRTTLVKEDQLLQFNLNGNWVRRIKDSKGRELQAETEYRVEPAGGTRRTDIIRFIQGTVARYVANQTVGIKEKLTLEFSSGAPIEIEVVVWEKPTLETIHDNSYAAAGKDFEIPVSFNGLSKVAAVKAVYTDSGKPILDDWTDDLGPLQAGYLVSVP
jgi:endoglucanase